MAKKKHRTTKKKKSEAETPDKPAFWPQASAVLMIVVALFLLLGGFGTGGPLLENSFSAVYWVFGWGAYLVPALLLFLGIWKFSDENKKLPLSKTLGAFAILIFTSGWLFALFSSENGTDEVIGEQGGAVGGVVGNGVFYALDRVPASILFFVLTILAFFLVFGISPEVLKHLFNFFKKPETEGELAEVKSKAGFQLNEGVPVERHSSKGLSTLKNTAQKKVANEDQAALTAVNDPNWQFPSLNLLNQKHDKADAGDVEGNAETIKEALSNFNINVEMEGANIGPRVTQYTLKPSAGTKLSKITALENNLALDLAAHSIRMEAPIPGKRAVGIEVPNVKAATVRISSLFQAPEWSDIKGPLGFAVGKDISGGPVVADLAKMPHILVAGQTGSGKSVMINTLLTSLLYRNSPSDLKLILVDPKRVELKPYDEIPHLLAPVITEPEKCISALKWTVAEMERRYRALSEEKRRNIIEYNELKKEEGMPYIVVVIDELAELMMMAARDVEALVVRIAQKARAVGIHLVLATQRPSVDVITGLIKANVPARIAFATVSQVDSRTIIDQIGAEKLLGQGDMLFKTAEMPKPKRIQGSLIGDDETIKVTDFLRSQRPPEYNEEITTQPVQIGGKGNVLSDAGSDADDPLYKDAVRAVVEGRKASTSLLQRRLRIGYGKAARFIETMEEQGIISPADGNRPREVLISSLDEGLGTAGDSEAASDEVLEENFPEEA